MSCERKVPPALTDDDRRAIGYRLLLARRTMGAARQEWLDRYGLYHSKYSMWETGKAIPDTAFLIALCRDHGFTLDWFYLNDLESLGTELIAAMFRTLVEQEAGEKKREARLSSGLKSRLRSSAD